MARRGYKRKTSVPQRSSARRGSTARVPLHRTSYVSPTVHYSASPKYSIPDRQVKYRSSLNRVMRDPFIPAGAPLDTYRFLNPVSPPALSYRPERTLCARREIRRQVIFASGRGGTKVARPKFTQKSKVHC